MKKENRVASPRLDVEQFIQFSMANTSMRIVLIARWSLSGIILFLVFLFKHDYVMVAAVSGLIKGPA